MYEISSATDLNEMANQQNQQKENLILKSNQKTEVGNNKGKFKILVEGAKQDHTIQNHSQNKEKGEV